MTGVFVIVVSRKGRKLAGRPAENQQRRKPGLGPPVRCEEGGEGELREHSQDQVGEGRMKEKTVLLVAGSREFVTWTEEGMEAEVGGRVCVTGEGKSVEAEVCDRVCVTREGEGVQLEVVDRGFVTGVGEGMQSEVGGRVCMTRVNQEVDRAWVEQPASRDPRK